MRAGVPQADVSVVATGEEVRLPGVDGQAPHLVRVTLERSAVSSTCHLQSPDCDGYFTIGFYCFFNDVRFENCFRLSLNNDFGMFVPV